MSSNAPERHHPFGPSRWWLYDKCPGARRLSEVLTPGDPGEPAKRGSRIHALAAELIQAGDEHEIQDADAEEYRVALEIAKFARAEIAAHPGMAVHVEQELSYVTMEGELYYGTADLLLVGKDGTGRLYDWKTGYLRVDEACDNWQGAGYALAAMQTYNLDTVEVCFYNPVIGQETRCSFNDAAALSVQVTGLAARTAAKDAPCVTGEHCSLCEAGRQGVCADRMAVSEAASNLADANGTCKPIGDWSDAALVLWLERLSLAAKMEEAVRAEIIGRCEAHGSCGGLEVRSQSGGREAADIAAVAFALETYLSDDDILDCCTLSVSKAKSLAVDRIVEAGGAETKKEAGAMFELLCSGMLSEKAPRKVLKPIREK